MKQLAQVKLNLSRATKGTFLYQTSDTSALVRNIYLSRKAVDGANAPTTVTVTVTVDDE